ncbi:hypothetical protein C8R45DRAFT_1097568 [Mycena sanguinolenta]|nr:hypothetical protein C8R45DRAFT_1097568 [Mycena sanguinolenta]
MANTTDPAPRKRKQTWKQMAKKDRRNLKLWADGARESILKPHIPAYTDALERGWRAERDYVQDVCNEFHSRILWRLPDDEEPELPLPDYDLFAALVVEELDEEDTVARRIQIETINARIGRWLKYCAHRLQRPTKMDRARDPFAVLMAKLAGHNAPPKARQAFQQYMHESYEKDIAPIVNARWAASCVARELFGELSKTEQLALAAWAKCEAESARKAYAAALKAPPSKNPVDRQRAIDHLGVFMASVLRGACEVTGLQAVCIFGGPIPQFNGELRTVTISHGMNRGPSPCNFAQWSKVRFSKEALGFMKEYLQTAYTQEDCLKAALPDVAKLLDAKYTLHDFSPALDDNDSKSDSNSKSGSLSDSDIMADDVALSKAQRKPGKHAAGKDGGDEGREGEGEWEQDAARDRAQGKKRKRDQVQLVQSESNKRSQSHSLSAEDNVASGEEDTPRAPALTSQQLHDAAIVRNKALLAQIDQQHAVADPDWAADREARIGKQKKPKGSARSRVKAKQDVVPRHRSGRGGTEKSKVDTTESPPSMLPPSPLPLTMPAPQLPPSLPSTKALPLTTSPAQQQIQLSKELPLSEVDKEELLPPPSSITVLPSMSPVQQPMEVDKEELQPPPLSTTPAPPLTTSQQPMDVDENDPPVPPSSTAAPPMMTSPPLQQPMDVDRQDLPPPPQLPPMGSGVGNTLRSQPASQPGRPRLSSPVLHYAGVPRDLTL